MAEVVSRVHVVLVGVEPWGHIKPFCVFAARLVQNIPVHITYFATPRVCDRVKAELASNLRDEQSDKFDLVRVVALDNTCPPFTTGPEHFRAENAQFCASFVAAYKQLLKQDSITCAATQNRYPALPSPKIVISDFIAVGVMPAVQTISKSQVINLSFYSSMATHLHSSFAPVTRDGRGDFYTTAKAEATRRGVSLSQAMDDLFHDVNDTIVHPPGLPPVHLWELDPQYSAHFSKGIAGQVRLAVYDNLTVADGLILTTPECYEPDAVAAIRGWLSDEGKGVWAIGPLLPSTTTSQGIEGDETLSTESSRIKEFMDNALKSHGEHSMLYISFGSLWWPPQVDKLAAFVHVVIERKIPFVFSHGSRFAEIPEYFRRKITASGVGLLTAWSSQQTILNHSALGWFVTHCGHNSVVEAVAAGVPLICWPFANDQPLNAVLLTEKHNVAYELIEVRTGNGLKPIHRNGRKPVGTWGAIQREARRVLQNAFGEDGMRKRENMRKLQEAVLAAWEVGGPAQQDFANFVKLVEAKARRTA